jgi:uncharacterized membrane protein YkoI
MFTKTKIAIAGGALAAAALAGTGIAVAGGGDSEPAHALTGAQLDQATAAALAETGGGHVTDSEVGDEESAYEIEVTLDDGSQVDVQLDENFAVVSSSVDKPDGNEADAGTESDARDSNDAQTGE